MNSKVKSSGKKRTAFLALFILFVYIFTSILIPYTYADHIAYISDNAIELEYDTNIESIRISYLVGDNWVEITDENCTDLPVNAGYQFDFIYRDINVGDLQAANGQMIYSGLPDWFVPRTSGVLFYGEEIVADINVEDGKVIITFYKDWLDDKKADTDLNGTFKVNGQIDWRELEKNGFGDRIPGLATDMSFEKDLAQKYGVLNIEKSEPVLISGDDGRYYLKYELTVTNPEDIEMTDVVVKDIFGNQAYIKGYVGITDGLEADGLAPQESSGSNPDFTAGGLSVSDGVMTWTIECLEPNGSRMLTYYAEISESYVSDIIGNPIANTARVYSGKSPDEVLKDMDTSTFRPKNDIAVTKDAADVNVDNNGNGTVTYTVTISASEDNSFVLKDLTLKDSLPEDMKKYISGDNGAEITVAVRRGTEDEYNEYTVDYTDAAFELSDLDLAPGDIVTITYTIYVRNIFFVNNGHAELTNTATVSKGARTMSSAVNTESLEKQTWSRKIVGSPAEESFTVQIASSDKAYKYNDEGTAIIEEAPHAEEFDVPDGSLEYQVVLNENGQWDLSSASMQDKFDSIYLKYVGYVRIQLIARKDGAPKDLSDSDLIAELEKAEAEKTVWLKVDAMGSFAFKPEDLGIDGGKYTYLLTYYAQTSNMDDVGSASVSNSFRLEGTVGNGDGFYELPAIEVSVGTIVQGGVKYNVEKESWYYAPYPVYKTEAMESGVYPESGNTGYKTQYTNGAIYWVIRLDGDIGTSNMTDKGNANTPTSFDGFYIQDKPDASNQKINRDAVVGVYVGDRDFDFTSYDSFPKFIEEFNAGSVDGLERLNGNCQNDKWFGNTAVKDPDYEWYADDAYINGIIFKSNFTKKYDKNTQAVYIVLRSALTSSVPTGSESTKIYTNELYIESGAGLVKAAGADYKYEVKTSLFKESKGAYIYDKEKGTFENCSSVTNVNGWIIKDKIDESMLDSSGIYAAWLLNVNWNGSMSGTYDIEDRLPEGMELLYVDVNNFGTSVKRDKSKHPKTEYIQELNSDPGWREMTKTGIDDIGNEVETITYYDPETRVIRWRISNLTREDGYKKCEINFRIICKVTDPELFLKQIKTYVNQASVLDSQLEPADLEEASVTITLRLDKNIDYDYLERIGGTVNGGSISLTLNKLPFKIEINPFGDDICDGDTLPALIDELSPTIELIEDSIEVVMSDGSRYTDFTYDIEYADGHQILIVYGLPDGLPLTLSYSARLNANPKESVGVYNTAYWAGNPQDDPQVNIPEISYDPSGDVFTKDRITVQIIKADADSHSKKLNGAVFELYDAESGELLRSGITDSMGKAAFDNRSGGTDLEFDKVYCIIERTAPSGYVLNEGGDEANSYYFIIIDPKFAPSDEELEKLVQKYPGLDIWYDSPDYSIVIENKKGTISAEKVFIDENGNSFTPTSGSYRFGLFDIGAAAPREILTIVYNEDGTQDYYLDGIPRESSRFTKFDPQTAYQIYELDEEGKPIPDGKVSRFDGVYYQVTYSADRVTVNGTVTITNSVSANNFVLPSTGGIGIYCYVYSGIILLMISLIAYLLSKHNASDRSDP